jgi:hypothetical protein
MPADLSQVLLERQVHRRLDEFTANAAAVPLNAVNIALYDRHVSSVDLVAGNRKGCPFITLRLTFPILLKRATLLRARMTSMIESSFSTKRSQSLWKM